MYEFCESKGIEHERCGKLIVARDESELGRLDELERRGRENQVPGLRRLSAGEIAEVEPHCRGVAALHSPNTGIVDFAARRARAGAGALGRAARRSRSTAASTRSSAGNGPDRARRTRRARRAPASRCSAPGAGRTSWRWPPAPRRDPRIVPFRGAYLYLKPDKRPAGALDDLPGARPVAAVPRRAPDPAHRRPRVARPDRAAGAALDRRPGLAGDDPDGPEVVAHRHHRDPPPAQQAHARARRPPTTCRSWAPTTSTAASRAGARRRSAATASSSTTSSVSETERALHVRNAPSPAATSSFALARLIADRAEPGLA